MEEAFYRNFHDVKKNSGGLWANPEFLKKVTDDHG